MNKAIEVRLARLAPPVASPWTALTDGQLVAGLSEVFEAMADSGWTDDGIGSLRRTAASYGLPTEGRAPALIWSDLWPVLEEHRHGACIDMATWNRLARTVGAQ